LLSPLFLAALAENSTAAVLPQLHFFAIAARKRHEFFILTRMQIVQKSLAPVLTGRPSLRVATKQLPYHRERKRSTKPNKRTVNYPQVLMPPQPSGYIKVSGHDFL
jgi:hypothetical protein